VIEGSRVWRTRIYNGFEDLKLLPLSPPRYLLKANPDLLPFAYRFGILLGNR
jgi:hypothetical protein